MPVNDVLFAMSGRRMIPTLARTWLKRLISLLLPIMFLKMPPLSRPVLLASSDSVPCHGAHHIEHVCNASRIYYDMSPSVGKALWWEEKGR